MVTAFLKVLFNPLDEIAWMRLLRLLPGIGNTTAHRIFMVFQSQQAVRLTKDNVELQKLIPKKALDSWNVLLEIFQQMLEESVNSFSHDRITVQELLPRGAFQQF